MIADLAEFVYRTGCLFARPHEPESVMTPALLLLTAGFAVAPPVRGETAALAYLAREVPRWSKDNRCYSCHHNGDAARALYTATIQSRKLPASALADTTRWLARPEDWDRNGGKGPFNDKKLARLQFAVTLVTAHRAKAVTERRPLEHAANLVAGLQDADGSWRVVPLDSLGSATTLGNALATHLARDTLLYADAKRHKDAIARADGWLRKTPIDSVLDAGAILLALADARDAPALAQKRRCLDLIRKGRSRSGGWGPYVGSAPEVFDTAVVVLALSTQPGTERLLRGGRAYLLATQESDGCWPETTRPSGADSFAQRLSTAGWATLALLATDPVAPSPRKAP